MLEHACIPQGRPVLRGVRAGYPFICLFQNAPNQRASYARPFITPGTETSFITENPWVEILYCIVSRDWYETMTFVIFLMSWELCHNCSRVAHYRAGKSLKFDHLFIEFVLFLCIHLHNINITNMLAILIHMDNAYKHMVLHENLPDCLGQVKVRFGQAV